LKKVGKRATVNRDPSLDDGTAAKTCLMIVPVDSVADHIERTPLQLGRYEFGFADGIDELMRRLNSEPYAPRPGAQCKSCEFRATPVELTSGIRDGRTECWSASLGVSAADVQAGSILDLYNYRSAERLIDDRKLLLSNLVEADLPLKEEDAKISSSYRQWLQCDEARGDLTTPWFMHGALAAELATIRYPLHFVDFETARPALPLHAGRHPYEQILFQFSHHIVEENGTIRHAGEYLYRNKGVFPNFEVLHALKEAVGNDGGSVLHWWDHERTVLGDIQKQLQVDDSGIQGKAQLNAFIDSMLGTTAHPSRLFDLGQMTQRTIFLPGTRGSSSLKKVLPALLAHNALLREKYGQPVYGSENGIRSLNFRHQRWVQFDGDGRVIDPYKLLGERFEDSDLAGVDEMESESVIAEGGAAMVAYYLLEGETLSDKERDTLRRQLLRYCELDTLAMVMAWQAIQTFR
jgi:hypothetical protein